ncbi:hypothetical protein [Mycoplasma struthionis]|uniref:Uncharacterized protein n=1 Tax=Mycoplasma struthionis TaxID=538220 RepID=A0A502M251_9MOLU|nr:hypothetical protein [Mycoplasma struthionis]TPI01489.1 hypothetical protein FJM01_02465 [Mycoplasma struthionis]
MRRNNFKLAVSFLTAATIAITAGTIAVVVTRQQDNTNVNQNFNAELSRYEDLLKRESMAKILDSAEYSNIKDAYAQKLVDIKAKSKETKPDYLFLQAELKKENATFEALLREKLEIEKEAIKKLQDNSLVLKPYKDTIKNLLEKESEPQEDNLEEVVDYLSDFVNVGNYTVESINDSYLSYINSAEAYLKAMKSNSSLANIKAELTKKIADAKTFTRLNVADKYLALENTLNEAKKQNDAAVVESNNN